MICLLSCRRHIFKLSPPPDDAIGNRLWPVGGEYCFCSVVDDSVLQLKWFLIAVTGGLLHDCCVFWTWEGLQTPHIIAR